MAYTRRDIREELAKRHPGLGRLGTCTADAADANEFIDTQRFLGVQAQNLVLQGAPVYVSDTTDDLAPKAESAVVEDTPAKISGTVEIEPALTANLAAGDTIEVWHRDLQHIDRVNECINRALRLYCHRWVLVPLTMLLDGDMELPTVDSNIWWTSGTVAKVAGSEGDPVRQFMRVSSIDGYAHQAVAAEEGEEFFLAVLGRRVSIGSGRVRISDGRDNYTTLTGDGDNWMTHDVWAIVRNTFIAPSGGLIVHNGDIMPEGFEVEVNAGPAPGLDCGWIVLQRRSATEMPLPARIKQPGAVGRVFRVGERIDEPIEPPHTWNLKEVDQVKKFQSRVGDGTVILRFPHALGSDLYFYEERQPYEELADDETATAAVDLDWVVETAALECYLLAYRNWRAGAADRAPSPGMPTSDPNPWRYSLERQMGRASAVHRLNGGEPETIVRRL